MAEPVKKPPKMCAVCGQVLDQWLGQWIHTTELAGKSDHVAVPVDYDESMLVARCDFCHDVVPLADRWVVPASDFMTPIGTMSDGNWMACPPCARLVAANKWDTVVEQLMKRQRAGGVVGAEAVMIRAFLVDLYALLKKHQTGPPRPFRAGDEGAEYRREGQ